MVLNVKIHTFMSLSLKKKKNTIHLLLGQTDNTDPKRLIRVMHPVVINVFTYFSHAKGKTA